FDEKHQFENPGLIENAIFQQRVIITKIENGAIIEKVCADELDDLHFYKGLAQRAGVLICHLLAPLSRLSCVSRRRCRWLRLGAPAIPGGRRTVSIGYQASLLY